MSERAATTAFGYVVLLGLTTLLTTGIVIGVGDVVDSQREQVVREGLETVAERLSATIEGVDRVAVGTTAPRLSTSRVQNLPDRIAGRAYQIEIVGSHPNERLVLTAPGPEVTVSVDLVTNAPVRTRQGGPDSAVDVPGIQGGTVIVDYREADPPKVIGVRPRV